MFFLIFKENFFFFWTKHFVKCVQYKIDYSYICFLFLKAEIQAFFAANTEHNCMVNKCTRNSSFRMYFKGHTAYNGITRYVRFLVFPAQKTIIEVC